MRIFKREHEGANGERVAARVYAVRFSLGGKLYEKSLGTRDRNAANLIAAEIVRKAEMKRAGIVDPFGGAKEKALDDHFTDFETTMRARGVAEKYVENRLKCLREYATHSAAKSLGRCRPGSLLCGKKTRAFARRAARHTTSPGRSDRPGGEFVWNGVS